MKVHALVLCAVATTASAAPSWWSVQSWFPNFHAGLKVNVDNNSNKRPPQRHPPPAARRAETTTAARDLTTTVTEAVTATTTTVGTTSTSMLRGNGASAASEVKDPAPSIMYQDMHGIHPAPEYDAPAPSVRTTTVAAEPISTTKDASTTAPATTTEAKTTTKATTTGTQHQTSTAKVDRPPEDHPTRPPVETHRDRGNKGVHTAPTSTHTIWPIAEDPVTADANAIHHIGDVEADHPDMPHPDNRPPEVPYEVDDPGRYDMAPDGNDDNPPLIPDDDRDISGTEADNAKYDGWTNEDYLQLFQKHSNMCCDRTMFKEVIDWKVGGSDEDGTGSSCAKACAKTTNNGEKCLAYSVEGDGKCYLWYGMCGDTLNMSPTEDCSAFTLLEQKGRLKTTTEAASTTKNSRPSNTAAPTKAADWAVQEFTAFKNKACNVPDFEEGTDWILHSESDFALPCAEACLNHRHCTSFSVGSDSTVVGDRHEEPFCILWFSNVCSDQSRMGSFDDLSADNALVVKTYVETRELPTTESKTTITATAISSTKTTTTGPMTTTAATKAIFTKALNERAPSPSPTPKDLIDLENDNAGIREPTDGRSKEALKAYFAEPSPYPAPAPSNFEDDTVEGVSPAPVPM